MIFFKKEAGKGLDLKKNTTATQSRGARINQEGASTRLLNKTLWMAGQGIDVWVGKLLSACMGISVTVRNTKGTCVFLYHG